MCIRRQAYGKASINENIAESFLATCIQGAKIFCLRIHHGMSTSKIVIQCNAYLKRQCHPSTNRPTDRSIIFVSVRRDRFLILTEGNFCMSKPKWISIEMAQKICPFGFMLRHTYELQSDMSFIYALILVYDTCIPYTMWWTVTCIFVQIHPHEVYMYAWYSYSMSMRSKWATFCPHVQILESCTLGLLAGSRISCKEAITVRKQSRDRLR